MSRTDPTTDEILAATSIPLPDDSQSVTRRRFLQAAAATTGAAALPTWMADAAGAAAPIGPGDGVLVLITMGGGNDGLNTVVPIGDGAYYDRRRSLAITPEQARPLTDDRGLHPRLDAVEALWRTGDVAVIDGVGAPGTDLSHFSSMARWMAGNADDRGFHSGWLGRYIDGLPGGDDPYHGVALGTSIPLAVVGEHRQASGLPPDTNGLIAVAGSDATQLRQYEAIRALAAAPTGRGHLADALAAAGPLAIDLSSRVEPVYHEELPDGDVKRQLDLCARLINANLGIRVFSVIYGDFDSHADQAAMHDARMRDLNEGIKAFYNKLHPAYHARALLLTVSEFGRRVEANHSGGTDHGAANTLLAIGTQVEGGFYGALPSLTNLDRQGNLRPTVDYRSVYATVLDTWLGADANQVLNGHHENLGFVAPPAPNRTTSGLNPATAAFTFKYRAQIIRLYLAYFGRLPESTGLDHWVTARRHGTSLASVADAFAGSEEFRQRYGHLSHRAFVELAYQNVLGRPGDGPGLDHWTDTLDRGGSRGGVMLGFSESAEFVASAREHVSYVDGNGPVARLYLAYFGRAAEDAGLRHWIGTGLPYAAVSEAFAASDEFRLRYGPLDNLQFLELVYQNVLGRASDRAGREYWLGELGRGVSRGRVMLGFSESAEFIVRTATLA